MMHRSIFILTLVSAALAAGCVDIAIPDDAIISCGEGGACPGGTRCNDVINRCVPDEPIETDPPSVSGVAIAPAVGRVGTTFTVGFTVDEPLGVDPIVTVEVGGAEPVRLSAAAGDKNDPTVAWSFTYEAAGTEVEGTANAFARVIDIWGNERTAALAPGLGFDFTAPVVTDPGLPATINVVDLVFDLSLEGASRLAVTGDIEDDKDLVVTGNTVEVDVAFVAGDGAKALRLVASDEVGNTTTLDLDFTLDSTVPFSAPIIAARDGQSAVKNNDTIDVSGQVTAGATLLASRLLDQDNNFLRNVTGIIVNPTTGVLSGSVAVGALATATSLRLEVTVTAGGVPSVDAQSRSNVIAVDNLPPTSPTCVLPARVVTANVALQLSATDFIDVEVVGDVVEPRPFLPLAGNASSGTVNLILSGAEGNKTLTARFRDGAHNLASCNATTLFDAGAPVVTDVLLVPPAGQSAVRSNQVVGITASVDVVGTTVVNARLLNAAFGFIANVPGVTVVGGDVSGSFLVSDLVAVPPAGLVLELVVSDGALNSLAVRSPQLDIDNVPPTDPVLSAPADIGAFDVDVDIAGCVGAEAVAVTGDVAANDGVFVPFPAGGSLSVTLTAGIGAKTITAQCRDRAFNLSGTDSVVVNLTTDDVLSLPALSLPGTQTAVKNGDTVTIGGTGEVGATIVAVRVVNAANGAVVQTLLNSVMTLAGNGSMSGSFVTSGLTNATNISLEVILNARGRDSVAGSSRSNAFPVDLVAPAAPARSSLRLVENTAAANDPARLTESVDNSFTVTGLGAAVLDGVSVDRKSVV